MVFTEKSVRNRSFQLAEGDTKFTLNALLLVSNPVEMDMLYETSKMQMIYQHILVDIGNITVTFPFTGLLIRTIIFKPALRMSAHVATAHQLVVQAVEDIFG
jgi:Na+/phosphate symporter